jgi:hypothetical protein
MGGMRRTGAAMERASISTLMEHLSYDPATGEFRWRTGQARRRAAIGDVAGHMTNKGYWSIKFRGRRYFAHQLAHAFMTGAWAETVDHKDRDPLNNRWHNLRAASPLQQNANRGGMRAGMKGVTIRKRDGRFQAQIKCRGRNHYLGTFDTEIEAAEAYQRKASELFGEFASAA